MFLRRQLYVRAGLFSYASRASGQQQPPATSRSISGLVGAMGNAHIRETVGTSLLGRFNMNLSTIKVNRNISLPCATSVSRFIHSGNAKESEASPNFTNTNFGRESEATSNFTNTNFGNESGDRSSFTNAHFGRESRARSNFTSINFGRESEGRSNFPNTNLGREIFDRTGNNFMDSFRLSQQNIEQNADIVHIRMLRNNTFVTVTDSKGNKKFGVSAGKLTDKGGKVSRYAAEASAEQAGRDIRGRGIKSVVVKVNGFTFFKKKKQAILGIREGYSHSRGDTNPIVYIEDTTRRPHNGCRLRKKRRV